MSTVLITGASRGIGRATAKAFANSGWDLLLLARSEDDLERLVVEIDNKKVIDFLNTFKIILDNPNIKGEFRTNLTDALINQDYGMLDAEDMDYILQTCIFGSCVYAVSYTHLTLPTKRIV